MNVQDSEIKDLLTRYRKFAVYGLSPDVSKPSRYVPEFMKAQGYDIVGTYPTETEIGSFRIYRKLSEVPQEYRKFVDVFRAPNKIPSVVDEVIAAGGVEVLWLQLGITHPEAEKRAEDAGIKVVSNRCLIPEYRRWFQS